MRRHLTLAGLVISQALALSCKDDDGEGSNGPGDDQPTLQIDNTVDESTFRARLGELTKLLDTAKSRTGLPSVPATEACDDGGAPFGALALQDQRDDFALTTGLDCSDALERMRSFYRNTLLASGQGAARLSTAEPGSTNCGRKVEQAPIDPKRAAIGRTLRLADATTPDKKRDETVVGGANDLEVGLQAKYRAECAAAALGCEKDERLEATTETRVNLKDRTVALASKMTQYVGESHDASVDTSVAFRGLKEGEKVVIEEKTTQVLTQFGGTPETTVVVLTFAEGKKAKTLDVTGTVEVTKDGVTTKQEIKTFLDASSGSCRVGTSTTTPNQPTPSPSPTTPVTPAPEEPKITVEKLAGSWVTPCEDGDLGYLNGVPTTYSSNFDEFVGFTNAGGFQYVLNTYTDGACFPGTERATIQIDGSFGVKTPTDLDLTLAAVTVTLRDDALVTKFNNAKACNRTDWAKGTPVGFAPGACFFDLAGGGTAFLKTDVLKWAALYTSGEITSGGALLEISKPGIAGDQPGARPRAGSNERTFKRR